MPEKESERQAKTPTVKTENHSFHSSPVIQPVPNEGAVHSAHDFSQVSVFDPKLDAPINQIGMSRIRGENHQLEDAGFRVGVDRVGVRENDENQAGSIFSIGTSRVGIDQNNLKEPGFINQIGINRIASENLHGNFASGATREYKPDELAQLRILDRNIGIQDVAEEMVKKFGDQLEHFDKLTQAQRYEIITAQNEAFHRRFSTVQDGKPRPQAPDVTTMQNPPANLAGLAKRDNSIQINDSHATNQSFTGNEDLGMGGVHAHEFGHNQQMRQMARPAGFIDPIYGQQMWLNNQQYIKPGDNFQGYRDQPMETDARDWGAEYNGAIQSALKTRKTSGAGGQKPASSGSISVKTSVFDPKAGGFSSAGAGNSSSVSAIALPPPNLDFLHTNQQTQTQTSTAASPPIKKPEPVVEQGLEAAKAEQMAGNMSWLRKPNSGQVWNFSGSGLESVKTDGMTTERQKADFSLQNGFGFDFNQSRTTETDANNAMSSQQSLSFKDGQFGVGWGSGDRSIAEDGSKVSNANNFGFQLGVNGFGANYSKENVTEIDGQSFANSSSHGLSNRGYTYSNNRSTTNAAGEITSSNANSVALGLDGVNLANTKTDAKGNQTSTNIGGDAKFDEFGNLNAVSMNAGVSRNGKSVSVSGGYEVHADQPVEQNGKWLVKWEKKLSAGAQAGASKGPVGGSVGASVTDSQFGIKSFKTKTEAEAFQKDAAAKLPQQATAPETAEDAMSLEVGEERGHSEGTNLSASGSVSPGPVGSFEAGLSSSDSRSSSVRRVSASEFEVTYMIGEGSGKNFGASAFKTGASYQSSSDMSFTMTARFNLSDQLGRTAFELFNKTGLLTPGGKLISTKDAKGEENSTTVNISPWFKNARTHRSEEEVTQSEQGKLERYSGRAGENIKNTMFGFEGHDDNSFKMDAFEINDARSVYAMQGAVDTDDGAASMRHLSEITGMVNKGTEGAKSSGKWQVDVEITDEMVNRLMAEIEGQKARDVGIFELYAGTDHLNELRKHLQTAKSSDDRKRALTRFVAAAGNDGKAIKAMRDTLWGVKNSWSMSGDYEMMKANKLGNFNYDLTLEGDKNFQGVAMRQALEQKIAGFQSAITQNPASAGGLHQDIQATLNEVRRQRSEIADEKRYSDLPHQLREVQLTRLDAYIEQLSSLRAQAGESAIESDAQHSSQKVWQDNVQSGAFQELTASIAEWSGYIKSDSSDYQFQLSQWNTTRKDQFKKQIHLDQYNNIHQNQQAAEQKAEKAKKLNREIDELRAEYLGLRANPQQQARALSVGSKLLEMLKEQSALWDDAMTEMEDSANRLGAALEEAEDGKSELSYTPTAMALEEPSRNAKKKGNTKNP